MATHRKRDSLPGDDVAARLVELYSDAEAKITQKLLRAMAESDGESNRTLRYFEQQQKAVKKILKELNKKSKPIIDELVDTAFNGGLAVSRKELKDAGITDVVLEMGGINAKAMKIYAEQVYGRMADVIEHSNRTTRDVYQALKLQSSMGGAVGGYDAIGNVRRNMRKIADEEGITAFIDKAGRSWTMETYCEMLTRTATAQIYHQAKTNEYLAHGEDLVIVTSHTPTCKKCSPWGGKILSLTGETKGYPTMEEAKASGLFHPNCRHTYSLWIEFDDETNNSQEQIQAEKLAKDGDDGSINADVGLQEALVYPRNGKKDFIPKNTEFSSAPKVIAGIGSHTEIREIQKLIDKYGGTKYDWMKKVAKIESARYIFDVHWYQKGNKQYKTKVKERRGKDGDRGLSV